MSLVYLSGIQALTMPAGMLVGRETPVAETEEQEWQHFHAEAYDEYAAEFTALFNSYDVKWAKNGRLMLREGDSGPYKFVKRSN
jgi:hypothetical protein